MLKNICANNWKMPIFLNLPVDRLLLRFRLWFICCLRTLLFCNHYSTQSPLLYIQRYIGNLIKLYPTQHVYEIRGNGYDLRDINILLESLIPSINPYLEAHMVYLVLCDCVENLCRMNPSKCLSVKYRHIFNPFLIVQLNVRLYQLTFYLTMQF